MSPHSRTTCSVDTGFRNTGTIKSYIKYIHYEDIINNKCMQNGVKIYVRGKKDATSRPNLYLLF